MTASQRTKIQRDMRAQRRARCNVRRARLTLCHTSYRLPLTYEERHACD